MINLCTYLGYLLFFSLLLYHYLPSWSIKMTSVLYNLKVVMPESTHKWRQLPFHHLTPEVQWNFFKEFKNFKVPFSASTLLIDRQEQRRECRNVLLSAIILKRSYFSAETKVVPTKAESSTSSNSSSSDISLYSLSNSPWRCKYGVNHRDTVAEQ